MAYRKRKADGGCTRFSDGEAADRPNRHAQMHTFTTDTTHTQAHTAGIGRVLTGGSRSRQQSHTTTTAAEAAAASAVAAQHATRNTHTGEQCWLRQTQETMLESEIQQAAATLAEMALRESRNTH